MPFTIENKEESVIKIVINKTITLDELKKILGIFTRVFTTKKYFAFYVDCNFTEVPNDITQQTKYLLTWLNQSKAELTEYLQASCLILKSGIVEAAFSNLFKIYKTVKPNYITTNYKLGEEFVLDIMRNYKNIKKI